MEKILVTVEEASQIMSMGRTRIYELIKNGHLKSIKCGKSRRIVTDSIRAFVENANN
jgi:excisionase family DNA binding protein